MFRTISAISALVLGLSLSASAAILTGIFPDDATADYAVWDSFTDSDVDTDRFQEYPLDHPANVPGSFSGITITPFFLSAPSFSTPPAAQVTLGDGDLYSGGSVIPRFELESTYSGLSEVKTIVIQWQLSKSGGGPSLDVASATMVYGGITLTPEFTDFSSNTSTGYAAWQFDLTGLSPVGTDFLFQVNGSNSHTAVTDVRVDLSTTSFDGVNLIPEPGAGALALLATTGTLLGLRRRRRK